jgi:FMN phosphatase YigB (HAD superfamily)
MARAFVFDAYGTLFDVHSAIAARLQRRSPARIDGAAGSA